MAAAVLKRSINHTDREVIVWLRMTHRRPLGPRASAAPAPCETAWSSEDLATRACLLSGALACSRGLGRSCEPSDAAHRQDHLRANTT